MDDFLTKMFNLLPESWRPYVVLFLIVAYVATKWRSNRKSAIMRVHAPKGFVLEPKTGAFSKIVDFLF